MIKEILYYDILLTYVCLGVTSIFPPYFISLTLFEIIRKIVDNDFDKIWLNAALTYFDSVFNLTFISSFPHTMLASKTLSKEIICASHCATTLKLMSQYTRVNSIEFLSFVNKDTGTVISFVNISIDTASKFSQC